MKLLSALLTLLCLALVLPASAQVLDDNGLINGGEGLFDIVNGFVVSDTFNLSGGQTVNGFSFGAWNEGSDPMTSLQWSLTSTAPRAGIMPGIGSSSRSF